MTQDHDEDNMHHTEQRRRYGNAAFIAGYQHGRRAADLFSPHAPPDDAFWTARQVATLFPAFDDDQIAAYLNGQEDGLRGDAWRYDLLLARSPRQIAAWRRRYYG